MLDSQFHTIDSFTLHVCDVDQLRGRAPQDEEVAAFFKVSQRLADARKLLTLEPQADGEADRAAFRLLAAVNHDLQRMHELAVTLVREIPSMERE